MRIFLLISMLFFTLFCAVPKHIPAKVDFIVIDFSKYSKRGFLFTPFEYNGRYDAVASFIFRYNAEANRVQVEQESRGKFVKSIMWVYDFYSVEHLMDTVYVRLHNMGADALINLKYDFYDEDYYSGTKDHASVPSFVLTGFAIKRRD